jgi:ankyrin repeat protein
MRSSLHEASVTLRETLELQRLGHVQLPKILNLGFNELTDSDTNRRLAKHHSQIYPLQWLIYMVSNNLLPQDKIETVVKWFDSHGDPSTLKMLQNIGGPSVRIFVREMLISATCTESIRVTEALLDAGVSPNFFSRRKHSGNYIGRMQSALSSAVRLNNPKLVSLLLRHNADPNVSTPPTSVQEHSQTPLEEILEQSWEEWLFPGILPGILGELEGSDTEVVEAPTMSIIELLVNAGGLIRSPHVARLWEIHNMAVSPRRSKLLSLLEKAHCSLDDVTQLDLQLHNAVMRNDLDQVRTLFTKGADLDSWCFYPHVVFPKPISRAACLNNTDMVKVLLELGAEVNGIIDKCELKPVEHLSDDGSYDGSYRECEITYGAIHHAAENGNVVMTEALLQKGANINLHSAFVGSPLQVGIEHFGGGQEDMNLVRLLLENGADINSLLFSQICLQNELLDQPAVILELVELLLDFGADATIVLLELGGQYLADRDDDLMNKFWNLLLDNFTTCSSTAGPIHAPLTIKSATEYSKDLLILLRAAICVRNFSAVRALLLAGADVDQLSGLPENYIYPQTWACNLDDVDSNTTSRKTSAKDIFMLLVEYGANIYDYNIGLSTRPYLEVAVYANDLDLINLVIGKSRCCTSHSRPLISVSIRTTSALPESSITNEVIDTFLATGAEIDDYVAIDRKWKLSIAWLYDKELPLDKYILGGCRKYPSPDPPLDLYATGTMCRQAISRRLNRERGLFHNAPMAFLSTPLQAASLFGNAKAAKHLLAKGANVNAPAHPSIGFTALQIAALHGDRQMMQILLEANACIDAPSALRIGLTSLQAAILKHDAKIINTLLQRGADVNAPAAAEYGFTALQAAVIRGDLPLVKRLLDLGADVNARPASHFSGTALQLGIKAKSRDITFELLDADANVNAPAAEFEGATALQYAVTNGDIDLVAKLLELGADVTAPASKDGHGALAVAALHGRLDITHLLLQKDLDWWSLQERCNEAAELAEKESHVVLAEVLRQWIINSPDASAF